ncbi:MAG: DUF6516 family protein [Bacteroidota bacterium]
MVKARLLLSYKARQEKLTMEMVLWQLPTVTPDRPHGLKYRLYLGRGGKTLVRYDNETGKGDHRHVGADETEEPYAFTTVERLIADFRAECIALGWRWVDEADSRGSDEL